MIGYPGDSKHEIVDGILKGGGKLHRFVNRSGVEYSAIYVNGFEVWSCEREHEAKMLKDWNAMRSVYS